MEQKRVLIDDPDTNWMIKRIGDEPDPFSSTDIGMIYESEPCQSCEQPDPGKPQRAKSSHKQNAGNEAWNAGVAWAKSSYESK